MKLKLTLFLLSVCLLFSACGGQSASFPDNSSVSSDWEGTPNAVESETQPEMQMAMPAGSLPMIAGNNEGAYYIWANGQDPSGLTLYYDYASRQLIHLSNQVLPTNDEENPGWIADIFGGAAPIAVNGKFYVLKYGKAPLPKIQYEGSPSILLEMEPNAANRKRLTLPSGILFKSYSGIAADGTDLYLLLAAFDSSTLQITEASLCRTDFDEGKINTLYDFDIQKKDVAIIGVYPQGLILQRSSFPSEYSNADITEQIEHLSYQIQLYSVVDNSLFDTDFCWDQGDLSFVLDGSTVYFVRSGETTLRKYDLLNATETVVTENILQGTDCAQADSVILTGEVYDEHFQFVVEGQETGTYYSYAISDGTVLPLKLFYPYMGAELPVTFVSESEEYFLVNNGMKTLQRAASGTDGTFYTMDSNERQYALIKKDDYWNSLPHYLEFNDSLLEELAASGC